MQQTFKDIDYIIGDEAILDNMNTVPVFPIFSNKVINFFDELSNELMHNDEAKKYPDVIAYAFWIRKAHLEMVKAGYKSDSQKIGRGVAFQIAPSNIPIQFAVSMAYVLIAGNASIVRISDKEFEQTDIICKNIKKLLDSSQGEMKPYICIVRYGHNDKITQKLTDLSDVRMVWGGDSTITAIREAKIGARCIDLGFADRYSIAVFDADSVLKSNIRALANDFYNDTYSVDQNACSSPRIVIWIGDHISGAKEVFWAELERLVECRYKMASISASEKLLNSAVFAAVHPDSKEIKNNNLLVRMEIKGVFDDVMCHKGNCGYFFEYDAKDLEELVPLLGKACQTIVFVGDVENRIREIISRFGVRGVDRIVPVGHGADISFVWDGLDLPIVLSRVVSSS